MELGGLESAANSANCRILMNILVSKVGTQTAPSPNSNLARMTSPREEADCSMSQRLGGFLKRLQSTFGARSPGDR